MKEYQTMKKQTNERKILNVLNTHGSMTQAELSKTAKVKGIYPLINRLAKKGAVVKNNGTVSLPVVIDTTEKIDPKKVSETVYKNTKPKAPAPGFVDSTLLEYFEVEHDRITKEIEVKLHEYAYVTSQIKKLSDETR